MIFLLYAGINTAWAGAILAYAVAYNDPGPLGLACCGPLLFWGLSSIVDRIRERNARC